MIRMVKEKNPHLAISNTCVNTREYASLSKISNLHTVVMSSGTNAASNDANVSDLTALDDDDRKFGSSMDNHSVDDSNSVMSVANSAVNKTDTTACISLVSKSVLCEGNTLDAHDNV